MSNQLSYCGLVDAKIRASDKDLPVPMYYVKRNKSKENFAKMHLSKTGKYFSPIGCAKTLLPRRCYLKLT